MPCGETSDRGDGGFKQFQFRVDGNIYPRISICLNGKHTRHLANDVYYPHQHSRNQLLKACTPTIYVFQNCPSQQWCVSSWRRDVVWWLCLRCQNDCFEAFNVKSVLASVVIRASNNDATPSALSLNVKMSSAKRRSSRGGYQAFFFRNTKF